jgi:putative membrane protein
MTEFRFGYVLNALIFTVLGLLVLGAALAGVDRLLPGRVWKAVAEEKNMALAVLVGAIAIAMGLVIAAAMH